MLLKYLLAEWVYLYKAYSLYPCPFTSKGKPADTAKEVEMLHYAPPSISGLTLRAFVVASVFAVPLIKHFFCGFMHILVIAASNALIASEQLHTGIRLTMAMSSILQEKSSIKVMLVRSSSVLIAMRLPHF